MSRDLQITVTIQTAAGPTESIKKNTSGLQDEGKSLGRLVLRDGRRAFARKTITTSSVIKPNSSISVKIGFSQVLDHHKRAFDNLMKFVFEATHFPVARTTVPEVHEQKREKAK